MRVGNLKLLTAAVAMAVVASAFALAFAVDPISKRADASGGANESGGSHSGPGHEGDCPEPDSCAEPGTTVSALAAI